MLEIRLFGSPQIFLDGQPARIERRKSRALLYYLAAHHQAQKREHLLSVFWPDSARPAAQQVLRTTLYGLHKSLGPDLQLEGDEVGLAVGSQIDVRDFEQILSASPADPRALNDAMDLYQGDFLENFSLPDTQIFEDWASIEREHYRRMAVGGLESLSTLYENSQNYSAALAALDRALAFNPLQEDLQRETIRLQFLAGDRPGAIRRYDDLRKLLDEEMGVLPMAETRSLYDSILSDHPETNSRIANRPITAGRRATLASSNQGQNLKIQNNTSKSEFLLPFEGRDVELQTLSDLAERRQLVLIEGEPGIGKTRLVEEFFGAHPTLILRGAGRELEQTLPYQPVIEALRGLLACSEWARLKQAVLANLSPVWLSEMSRLLPELATSLPSGQQPSSAANESRLWEGLHQFLNTLTTLVQAATPSSTITIFLDDLQWADASTLGLLAYLIRQPTVGEFGFIAATRPIIARTPLMSFVQALNREDKLTRLALPRLTAADVLKISRKLSPNFAQPLSGWLYQTSEGSPFVLAELARYAYETRLLNSEGALNLSEFSATPIVPQTVYGLIQSRLVRLSDSARRVLDAAVAAGREFEFEVVARAAALSDTAALDALDELRLSGLVHPTASGDRFTFDHTMTMEVAYREVGDPRHRMLHRRVAEALETLYSDRLESISGQLAQHFSEGRDFKRASPYAVMAGKEAVRLAGWTEAIAFFEMALQGAAANQRSAILISLGEAQARGGHSVQASESFREALNLIQTGDQGQIDIGQVLDVQQSLARSLLLQARYQEVIAMAQAIYDQDGPSSKILAQFLWGTALSLEGSDLEEAARHLQLAHEIARAEPSVNQAPLAQIMFELGGVAAQLGDLPKAIQYYKNSLEAASLDTSEKSLEQVILANNNLAYHLHLMNDPKAEEYALTGLNLAREKGFVAFQSYLLSTLGEIALAKGDLDEAEKDFEEGLANAVRISFPERVAGLTANLGLVALERDQIPLAIYRLSTALGQADALGTRHLAAQIRIWLAPLLPPAEARTRLAEARAIAESSGRKRLLAEIEQLEKKF